MGTIQCAVDAIRTGVSDNNLILKKAENVMTMKHHVQAAGILMETDEKLRVKRINK